MVVDRYHCLYLYKGENLHVYTRGCKKKLIVDHHQGSLDSSFFLSFACRHLRSYHQVYGYDSYFIP
ncbi:hypothetical protein BDA99DRAFT_528247 [Phascolomyces articulosus]|uniref:Uncharacterized protein n=1 Tax=Phascolomyces articulosus TaxID=60185 RepID=A0AAD5JMM8_9FUNG|nr:hypothetical protein BDA99DRAFT_528247 [Phascolomyces articulosus]